MGQPDLINPSNAVEAADEERLQVSISDRRCPELVIALVGPVGSGVSFTASEIQRCLVDQYAYEVETYKISELIGDSAALVNEKFDATAGGAERISKLQHIGNKLRKKFASDFLAEKCIEMIGLDRIESGGYVDAGEAKVPIPKRKAHIIDSLKNPAEAQLLRDVYGDIFWLIAVFAPEEVRKTRLESLGVGRANISDIISRDENESLGHGQNVRDTFQLADFFIRNDKENDVELARSVNRYLEILFNAAVHTPTPDEAAMYNAVSSAAKSACMSRQVGAAIYSSANELLGVGCNDVPKSNGGGLYTAADGDNDHRCYKWGSKICHNDNRKEKLYQKIAVELKDAGLLVTRASPDLIEKALSKTDIRNLIEYSRSVHAEMEAIISVARAGKAGLVGGTLYSTTFPCHNCARHIVASGIAKVIYIEPYPKSLATHLHHDSISVRPMGDDGKVKFLQYEGVAPKNVIRLFKHGHERKRGGRLIECDKTTAVPIFQPAMDGFTVYEQMIVKKVHDREIDSTKEEATN